MSHHVWKAIESWVDLTKDNRLNVGCGGLDNRHAGYGQGASGSYRCLDGFGVCPHSEVNVVCDLNGPWPVEDGWADTVTAVEVVEHLENFRHFLREIMRVTKPGGLIAWSTPNVESLASRVSFYNDGILLYFTREDKGHIRPVFNAEVRATLEQPSFDGLELTTSACVRSFSDSYGPDHIKVFLMRRTEVR